MDRGPQLETPSWLSAEYLLDFVEELRQAGYNIGVGEFIAAQGLVLALIGRGEDLSHPGRLKSMLGPLLVSTPFEQKDFGLRFDRWIQRLGYAAAQKAAPEMPEEEIRTFQIQWRRWFIILGVIAFLIILVGVIYMLSDYIPQGSLVPIVTDTSGTIEMPPALDIPWFTILGLAGLGLLAWAGNRWLKERQAHSFLARHATQQTPDIKEITVKTSQEILEPVLPGLTLLRLAQGLRHRIEFPSFQLDVPQTVEKTVHNGGWFTPVYGTSRVMPEYLVLVDRTQPGDHQAEFAREVFNRLRQLQVFVTGYYFNGDPRLCYPINGGAPQSLWEITTLYNRHRLILVSDTANLINPLNGEPQPWIERFSTMPERALLTPEPVRRWGYREVLLSKSFTVLPASLEGLELFVKILQGGEGMLRVPRSQRGPLPAALLLYPQRWLANDPPEPAQVQAMLADLHSYLGDEGYQWLCACAIYPELHWELTVYLGDWLQKQAIPGENGNASEPEGETIPMLTPRLLMDLARLPWMRHNRMPDWLRLRLIGSLPKQQERELREVLTQLLGSAVLAPQSGLVLEIARPLRRLVPAIARQLGRKEDIDSPYQDHVFLTFLSGRNPNSLAVRLPEALRQAFAARSSVRQFLAGVWAALAERRLEPAPAAQKAPLARSPLAEIRIANFTLPRWLVFLGWVGLTGLSFWLGATLSYNLIESTGLSSVLDESERVKAIAGAFTASLFQWFILRQMLPHSWFWLPASLMAAILTYYDVHATSIVFFLLLSGLSYGGLQFIFFHRYTHRAAAWFILNLGLVGVIHAPLLVNGHVFVYDELLTLTFMYVLLAVASWMVLTWMLNPAARKPDPAWGQPSEQPFSPESRWSTDRWIILGLWIVGLIAAYLVNSIVLPPLLYANLDATMQVILFDFGRALLVYLAQWLVLRRYTPVGVDWLWFSLGADFIVTYIIIEFGLTSISFLPAIGVAFVQIVLLYPLTEVFYAWAISQIPPIVLSLYSLFTGSEGASLLSQPSGSGTSSWGLTSLERGALFSIISCIALWVFTPRYRRQLYKGEKNVPIITARPSRINRALRRTGEILRTVGLALLGTVFIILRSPITWGIGLGLVFLFAAQAYLPALFGLMTLVARAAGFGLLGYGLYRQKRAAFAFQLLLGGLMFLGLFNITATLTIALVQVAWLAVIERLARQRETLKGILVVAGTVPCLLAFEWVNQGSLVWPGTQWIGLELLVGAIVYLSAFGLRRGVERLRQRRSGERAAFTEEPSSGSGSFEIHQQSSESAAPEGNKQSYGERDITSWRRNVNISSEGADEDQHAEEISSNAFERTQQARKTAFTKGNTESIARAQEADSTPARHITRPLYDWEIKEFYPLFGSTLDYSKVRVHENAGFTDAIDRIGRRLKGMPPTSSGSHNAITLGNHCYFPVPLPREPLRPGESEYYKLPWLAHELTHAWQYQRQGWMYLVRAILAQLRQREKAYDFGGEAGLREAQAQGKRFKDFNPEQQGNIVQSYYANRRAGKDTEFAQYFVDDLQDKIPSDRALV